MHGGERKTKREWGKGDIDRDENERDRGGRKI